MASGKAGRQTDKQGRGRRASVQASRTEQTGKVLREIVEVEMQGVAEWEKERQDEIRGK